VALAMFAVGWGANQFTPLLIAYRDELGMSPQTRAFLFGVYAAGLVPMLLLGGAASDRWGRRAVVLPAVALSPVASLALIAFHESTVGLAAARLLAGVCSGLVFGAASAWVSDLSAAEGPDDPGAAARRAAVALSAGFGVGPLVTGLLGEVVDHPLTVPYVPHLAMGLVALLLVRRVPGPRPAVPVRRAWLRVPEVCRQRRFLLVVVPFAPWVFGSVSVGFAYSPAELPDGAGELAFAGLLTGLSLLTGVLVQPWARRLEDRRGLLAAQVGMVAVVLGLGLCVLALHEQVRVLLLVCGPVLGVGYGCCLVSGLRETERLADPAEKGATVAVYYAVTYLGFAAPYLLGALAGTGLDAVGAVCVAAALAIVSLSVPSLARTRT
jgi:MFS family permease